MKEAIIFGLMNSAKMESTMIPKPTSTTARQLYPEKVTVSLDARVYCPRYGFLMVLQFNF